MATDTVIKVRFSGIYLCECGEMMPFVDPVEIGRRRMTCRNPSCPNNGHLYYEPVFVARDPAMGLDDGSL